MGADLVRTEVDVLNLVMILRNASIYRLAADKLLGFCIPGGKLLAPTRLARLAAAPEDAALARLLPATYARPLEPLADADLYVRENALWDLLYRKAHRAFGDFNRPTASVVAFPFLKRFEVLNLGRIFEGTRFGLGTPEVQSMMIGAGHV